MRPGRIVAVCIATLITLVAAVTTAAAQARFQVLAQETSSDVAGLRVVVMRDNQLAACYTLFILEAVPSSDASAASVAAPPVEEVTQQSIQRLREAAAKHDQDLAALKAEYEARVGTSSELLTVPGQSSSRVPSILFTEYEVKRLKIDAEYEGVLRTEIPGSYPRAASVPGMRTGGWEDSAEAMRRSLVNPDPAALRSPDDPNGINRRLESWFQRVIETPRLAASGPVSCPLADAVTDR